MRKKMIRFKLPPKRPLPIKEVIDGLWTVEDAYSDEQDFASFLKKYGPKQGPDAPDVGSSEMSAPQ